LTNTRVLRRASRRWKADAVKYTAKAAATITPPSLIGVAAAKPPPTITIAAAVATIVEAAKSEGRDWSKRDPLLLVVHLKRARLHQYRSGGIRLPLNQSDREGTLLHNLPDARVAPNGSCAKIKLARDQPGWKALG
jgi:hypothetical protein